MKKNLITIGIESSCDETSVGILKGHNRVLAQIVSSQVKEHQKYGGVVPEMASRLHVKHITSVIDTAMKEANLKWDHVDLVAATQGPGLLGALAVGFTAGKTLAYALKKPFIGVHHIEGHIFANVLDQPFEMKYPMLALVASGGHTQLLLMKKKFQYELVGNTLDDAIGEAFDKSARILGLGYPGGPIIDELAKQGNRKTFHFPAVRTHSPLDFSFSGLKTAVRTEAEKNQLEKESKTSQRIADFCASLQQRLVKELLTKTFRAADQYKVNRIIIAGGVTANSFLREAIVKEGTKYDIGIPKLKYCTDNGSMIAAAGYERFNSGFLTDFSEEPYASYSLAQK